MPSNSFKRTYRLFVGSRGEDTSIIRGSEITDLQIEFSIEIEEEAGTKEGNIIVKNLSQATVSKLSEPNSYVQLVAGYGQDNEWTIIKGDIVYIDTSNNGTDTTTSMYVKDGYNELVRTLHPSSDIPGSDLVIPKNTDLITLVELVFSFIGIEKGEVDLGDKANDKTSSAYTIAGPVSTILAQLLLRRGLNYWVDGGRYYVSPRSNPAPSEKRVWDLGSDSGMIGSPRFTRDKTAKLSENDDKVESGIEVMTLLNGRVRIGDKVNIRSKASVADAYDNLRVKKIVHTGNFESGDWKTELSLSQFEPTE